MARLMLEAWRVAGLQSVHSRSWPCRKEHQ